MAEINLLSSFDNNDGDCSVIVTNQCSKCGTTKRHSASSSPSSSSSQSPKNLPSKIQPNIISASFSNPNNPSQLQSMSSAFSTPSPTLPLLPSSPPPLKLNSFSDRRPVKLDSLSIPRTKSWQELVSSAFPPTKSWQEFVSSCGGGGGSQRQDSPLQSISNSPVSPLSPSFVPPLFGC
ncbi:hypothetical protein MKW98_013706 [Papaver atlanticum]|uniref:Uncharacterized protein n=1 Tax=Papaver atlanticum TaxID=357466 RepID=A0AAD4XCZ5_9MAGN|nr:hypothetical protein MKW98_013706 [Papaver atlanticum]